MENLVSRAYAGLQDLEKMRSLLIEGRRVNNGTYYIHIGDLNWWLFYPPIDFDLWQYISLWDDPQDSGRLLGWSLLSPTWSAFDVYVQPELCGSPEAEAMNFYTEEQIIRLARSQNKEKVYRMWVAQGDDDYIEHLLRNGFKRTGEDVVYMACSLDDPIPSPVLPEGVWVRTVAGEHEAVLRATAQYGAFESEAPFDRYLQRYMNFMHSPVYDLERDIVSILPDGRIGSFCIVWVDPVNQVGLFEPVGTLPDYRGRGLGKAVVLEGLRYLQRQGMRTAILCTNEDHTPAVKLYESVGFKTVDKHLTFEKNI